MSTPLCEQDWFIQTGKMVEDRNISTEMLLHVAESGPGDPKEGIPGLGLGREKSVNLFAYAVWFANWYTAEFALQKDRGLSGDKRCPAYRWMLVRSKEASTPSLWSRYLLDSSLAGPLASQMEDVFQAGEEAFPPGWRNQITLERSILVAVDNDYGDELDHLLADDEGRRVLERLLEDPGHRDRMMTNAIFAHDAPDVLGILFEHGAGLGDVFNPDAEARVPLAPAATFRGEAEFLEMVLDAGADPNATFRDGPKARQDAMRVALALNNGELLQILLDNGGDPEAVLPAAGGSRLSAIEWARGSKKSEHLADQMEAHLAQHVLEGLTPNALSPEKSRDGPCL